jgi:hypothetical protein
MHNLMSCHSQRITTSPSLRLAVIGCHSSLLISSTKVYSIIRLATMNESWTLQFLLDILWPIMFFNISQWKQYESQFSGVNSLSCNRTWSTILPGSSSLLIEVHNIKLCSVDSELISTIDSLHPEIEYEILFQLWKNIPSSVVVLREGELRFCENDF